MGFLDFIFPKYCVNCKKIGDYLCSACFSRLSFDTKNICLVCGRSSYDGQTHPICMKKSSVKGSFTGLVFNTVAKKLMYQFKYRPYLSGLSSFLGDLLYESLVQKEDFIKALESKPILVPIPLYSSKLKKRGYNQSELLARELAKRFDLEVVDCLERIKVTKSQVGLTKKERKENVRGAFEIKQNHVSQLMKKNIFMVDDVLTTGSTFSEACLVFKKNGAGTIWAIAFAKED